MALSSDNCCICQAELIKGSDYAVDYRCLNDRNVETIERFAKAWMEQGISVYDRCEKACRKYKEQKFEAAFHVQCYRLLLSNAEYLEACKKSSSSSRNGEIKTSAAAHSNGNSAAGPSLSSSGTSRQLNDEDQRCLKQAALILRERILKIPNGVFNNYSDEPSVYEFFARACYGESEIAVLPLTNQEYHLKILLLCKAVVAAVHKYKNYCSSGTSDEED